MTRAIIDDRIREILSDLEQCGYMGVEWQCISDDDREEVIQRAISTITLPLEHDGSC